MGKHVLIIVALAVALGGCASTPERQLIAANDLATTAYNEIAAAKSAGLVDTRRQITFYTAKQAIDAALDEAGRLYRAGNTDGMEASLGFVRAAIDGLRKLLDDLAKPHNSPAKGREAG